MGETMAQLGRFGLAVDIGCVRRHWDSKGRHMRQVHDSVEIETRPGRRHDITGAVSVWLGAMGANDGLLILFIRHTSASLTIQENADPDVHRDLSAAPEHLSRHAGRKRSVASINSCTIPGSVVAWPASGTILSSTPGHSLASAQAVATGVTTS